MLETMWTVAVALAYIMWWIVPVLLLTWLAVFIRDRADLEKRDQWPYGFEPPFNMDEESA